MKTSHDTAVTPRFARIVAALIVLACATGLGAALASLLVGVSREIRLPWMSAIGGEFALRLDPLAAVFMIPLCLVCGLAAVYGVAYLSGGHARKPQAGAWVFTVLLVVSMALVLLARNALLFLVAWEAMALTSFLLVTHDDEQAEVRRAGRTYLIATHLGTIFLLIFFLTAAHLTGSLDFDAWRGLPALLSPRLSALLFACAIIGFGTKAGFMPLHVWLPEAHPAAPSHVSAIMSGVMIKTGIYGLLRLLPVLGAPPSWWGWTLVAIGLSSGILGVLFALAQHDMKRLLAYSSVENIGVIALGLGVGYLGLSGGQPLVATLGFAGALLHVCNHAVFKSLLFLGAGAVVHAAGTREVDRLGGLLKGMPVTGACFCVGAAAICGLPPLNGFAGEFAVYLASLAGAVGTDAADAVALVAAAAGLALIGGLAAVCFAKLFGSIFLGEPRTPLPAPHEAPAAMQVPMLLLAAACCLVTPCISWVLPAFMPAVAAVMGVAGLEPALTPGVRGALRHAGWIMAGAMALIALAALARGLLLRRRPVAAAGTWDCGYAAPTARMQYTAASFVQPVVSLFAAALRTRRRFHMAPGCFPVSAALTTETADIFRQRLYAPFFRLSDFWISRMKWLQEGRVQRYVLYIVLTLLALLIWALGVAA
ncbi:MAG: proton-conducting transporter membrane subunit [Kiritimatiellae bacterium]|nr:proton-conducting transporter membrane subunit [Kiritimatiellia bacterium]